MKLFTFDVFQVHLLMYLIFLVPVTLDFFLQLTEK
jgi:hypothetical protein